MAQGWFESDEDYSARMRQEAAEKVIEDSTGSTPRQGFFESDDAYRSRVTQEANEHIIEDSSGSAPRQGFFESDSDYRTRVFEEANARIVEDSSGSAPRQGFFEGDDEYRSRVFREANEATIQGHSGSEPRQGFFESDGDYKRRVGLEAREFRAQGRAHGGSGSSTHSTYTSESDASYYSGSSSNSGGGGGAIIGGIIFVVLVVLVLGTVGRGPSSPSSNNYQPQPQSAPVPQNQGPVVRPFEGTGLIGVPSQGQAGDTSSTPSPACTGLPSSALVVICENADLTDLNNQVLGLQSDLDKAIGTSGALSQSGWQAETTQRCKLEASEADCLRSALKARHDALQSALASVTSDNTSRTPSPEVQPDATTNSNSVTNSQLVQCVLPSGQQIALSEPDCRARSGVVYN